jgi:hypothetical protein
VGAGAVPPGMYGARPQGLPGMPGAVGGVVPPPLAGVPPAAAYPMPGVLPGQPPMFRPPPGKGHVDCVLLALSDLVVLLVALCW